MAEPKFRVELDLFRGPLDLLLYLVRKHELEVSEISISTISGQYLEYLSILEQLDVNAVGDFLEIATILMEIKSRSILPHEGEEIEELADPRQDLVRRLLEYKQFRDAASILDERGRSWQEHFPRIANDVAPRSRNPAEEPLAEVELWDLVSAFGRIMRETSGRAAASVKYDDTPIEVYMARISERLAGEGKLTFSKMFTPGMHKSAMVGVFLAILELIKGKQVRVEQDALFTEIVIVPGDAPAPTTDAVEEAST